MIQPCLYTKKKYIYKKREIMNNDNCSNKNTFHLHLRLSSFFFAVLHNYNFILLHIKVFAWHSVFLKLQMRSNLVWNFAVMWKSSVCGENGNVGSGWCTIMMADLERSDKINGKYKSEGETSLTILGKRKVQRIVPKSGILMLSTKS